MRKKDLFNSIEKVKKQINEKNIGLSLNSHDIENVLKCFLTNSKSHNGWVKREFENFLKKNFD